MSKQLEKMKTAYSGWHTFSNEAAGVPATGQTDLEAKIAELEAELAAAKAPKKGKAKLEVVE